jgi:NAD(P)-dependent dehydrogenase (short-subunit alcohol dehydrogenase family)
MSTFQNKVVLIVGGTTGIGRAAALSFAKEGAKVVVSGRREAEGMETVRQIRQADGQAIFVQADVAREADVKRLVEQTVQTYGRLDIAFNNAGVEGYPGPIDQVTEEAIDFVFDINVKGTLLALKYEIPALRQSGGGSIINNASILGLIGFPNVSVYAGSKHAVLGITKSVALEVAKEGIRVNAVSPAAIDTDMLDRFTGSKEVKEQFGAQHPIGRYGRSQEIADAVLWLASDRSSFVTGQSITVDGGFTAQ